MAFAVGARVGPYQIVGQLGAGGMGEVYRARDPRLGRDIALKVIHRVKLVDGDVEEDAIDRLLREATLASALNHPNIVTIYETGTVGTDRYIAMELIEGATLRQLSAQGLAVDRAVTIARQVAEALAVAHAAQIVHRDVKPDNVMVRPDGYVKLLDFGLAKLHGPAVAAGSTGPTSDPGAIVGTVAYMAPEQGRGEAAAPEADIFAFGVLLYELLTGRHPFLASSQLGTLHALMSETPEPPSLLNPELPRAIEQLILEMLQKDARLRPGAGEVLYRLNLAFDATVAVALSAVTVSHRDSAVARAIVGRDLEMDALLHELDRVQRGSGRLVSISAEAGVGKTTLIDAFLRTLAEREESIRVGRGRCSERLAGSEAYLPVLEVLDSLQHSEQLPSLSRLIRAVAPSWYVQIASKPDSDSSAAAQLASETAVGSQERLKREILALFEEISRIQPLVVCLDDLHWADPSTTDLIGYLAMRVEPMRVLLVVASRPSELAQTKHPFLPLKLDLVTRGLCREITPGYLDVPAISRYLALQFPDHAFPSAFALLLHQRTEGHPLFVVDLLRELRRSQVLRQQDGRWKLTEDLAAVDREIPASVRSLVQRQMEALDEKDRRLLGAASVQGLDFDTETLAGALDLPAEEAEDRLERLEREHALVRFVDEWETPARHLTLRYRFAHHVYQNAFYKALRGTRRASLAQGIADRLVPRVAVNGEGAADLALLYETARNNIRAAEYFNQAAQAAMRLWAHDETERLARRGLELLAAEPEGPARAAVEIGLQMTYGTSLKTSRGYAVPEVGAAYSRARELCRQVEDPGRVIPVLVGLAAHHIVSGEITTSRDVALEMLDLFNRLGDPNLQMLGQWSLGVALFHLGELEVGHQHLESGIALYDPAFHEPRVWEVGIEPGIFCRCELSRSVTLRGYPDQGLAYSSRALEQGRALKHPQSIAFALLFRTFVHLARREPTEVLHAFEELAQLCRDYGIAQELAWAVPLRGRALVELGDIERGLRDMSEGLEAHTITRSALLRPYYFTLYAGALLRAHQLDEAQHALDQSRAVADTTSQRAYESEHRRLQAEVFMARGDPGAAELAYLASLTMACDQGARWLELRAARGYAHYLVETGREAQARDILRPIVEWFTEGRTTLDYVYADALLRTL